MNLLQTGIGSCAIALVACTSTVENDQRPSTSTSGNATSTTAATGGSGGAGGSGGGHEGGSQSETCQAMQAITITNPIVEDAGLDGTWSAGETATITVTLTSPQDTFDYPGVVGTHGSAVLSPPSAENWLFGLVAGEPTPIGVTFTAAPQTPPNTTVDIVLEVAALNESCTGLPTVTVAAVID